VSLNLKIAVWFRQVSVHGAELAPHNPLFLPPPSAVASLCSSSSFRRKSFNRQLSLVRKYINP
jgi:hypothetical protein